jgi:hypothetical protein
MAESSPAGWPGITGPPGSMTFDLTAPPGPTWATAYAAVNAEALRTFVTALPDVPELIVLDWQHHPLVATLGLTLGTWLPVVRVGGRPWTNG